jgi:hypothetical protein
MTLWWTTPELRRSLSLRVDHGTNSGEAGDPMSRYRADHVNVDGRGFLSGMSRVVSSVLVSVEMGSE